MADFKALGAREAAEILLGLDDALIIMHMRPDADTVGSAAALALTLRSLGKKAAIASSDEIPSRLKFLTEGVTVKTEIGSEELISIDVASPNQLGRLCGCEIKLMIDHHRVGIPFADNLIRPDASSAAEVLYEIISEIEKLTDFVMTKEIAERLYAAISSDTGGFIYSNASPKTYLTAARLIEKGIDHADINHRLFNSKSALQIKAEGLVAASLKTAKNGRIAYSSISKKDRENENLPYSAFDTAIDIVRALEGAEIALFIRENDEGGYRASMRSTGKNVADVAAMFSGGGHIRAAGCSPEGSSAQEVENKLLFELEKLFN